ncbi:hypothetical protein BC940DRAFT_164801 [Gongronella butleri]|nr:hypothetical protein BC940DRAFT_164801 [Gongronella butleri]
MSEPLFSLFPIKLYHSATSLFSLSLSLSLSLSFFFLISLSQHLVQRLSIMVVSRPQHRRVPSGVLLDVDSARPAAFWAARTCATSFVGLKRPCMAARSPRKGNYSLGEQITGVRRMFRSISSIRAHPHDGGDRTSRKLMWYTATTVGVICENLVEVMTKARKNNTGGRHASHTVYLLDQGLVNWP